MDNGWIKIHRKFKKWEWYQKSKMVHLFLHLLLSANHKDGRWQGHEVKRGQLITGLKALKLNTGISVKSCRTCLEHLKSTGEVAIKSTNRFSIITIVNYDEYQEDEIERASQMASQRADRGQAEGKQRATNNNDKNDKNEKNIYIAPAGGAEEIPDLLKDKQKHIQIIGLYARAKKMVFESKEQQSSFITRNLRSAKDLSAYDFSRIISTMEFLVKTANFKWTLESVGKYIDEDLNNLNVRQSRTVII